MARGLMIRMESMGPDGKDAEESLVVESGVTAAADEVETASGDVTEIDTGIDNATEAKGELDEVTDLVQEAVDDGDGLSPREAAHVEARLEHITSLLGTTAKKQGLVFRRESFGGSHSRLAATKMRLEDLKEFGKSVWEAIKRGWEWLKDAVKTIYAGLTKNAKMIIARFDDLQGRLDKITGNIKLKDSKLKVGAKWFSISDKTDKATIKQIVELNGSIGTSIKTAVEGLDQSAKATIVWDEAKASGAAKNWFKKEAASTVITFPAASAADVVSKAVIAGTGGADIKYTKKDMTPGTLGFGWYGNNKTFLLVPEEKTTGGVLLKTVKVSFEDADEKVATDYEAFNKADLQELISLGQTNSEGLESISKLAEVTIKAIDTGLDAVANQQKNIEEIMRAQDASKGDIKKVTTESKVKEATTVAVCNAAKTMLSHLPTQYFNTIKTLGDVINSGIGNLEINKN